MADRIVGTMSKHRDPRKRVRTLTQMVAATIPPEEYAKLEYLADNHQQSVSETLRQLISRFLERSKVSS